MGVVDRMHWNCDAPALHCGAEVTAIDFPDTPDGMNRPAVIPRQEFSMPLSGGRHGGD